MSQQASLSIAHRTNVGPAEARDEKRGGVKGVGVGKRGGGFGGCRNGGREERSSLSQEASCETS